MNSSWCISRSTTVLLVITSSDILDLTKYRVRSDWFGPLSLASIHLTISPTVAESAQDTRFLPGHPQRWKSGCRGVGRVDLSLICGWPGGNLAVMGENQRVQPLRLLLSCRRRCCCCSLNCCLVGAPAACWCSRIQSTR
jgi:hypothetical protein